MKKAVIFDMDGLLIDTEIITFRLYNDLLGRFGKSFSVEEYAGTYSGRTALRNMNALIESFGLPVSVAEGLDFAAAREKEYFKEGVRLKQGARDLLEFLRENGVKILLATSSGRERAEGVLRQNGIENFFGEMVFGAEIKNGKPHPDIFLKACEKAGEPPESCLVLEDSEAGIQAAHAAGIPVVCVPDMKFPAPEFRRMAAKIVPSLSDVIPLLRQDSL